MKQAKRVISLLLSLAMVVTGVNLGSLTKVQAAEEKDPKYMQAITGKLEKSDASSNDITLSTNNTTTSQAGSRYQAPYILGETAGAAIPGCGSDRYGCLVFELPEGLTQISAATVSFFVRGANNADHGNYWTKAALYQTANGEVTASDESTYRAINEDYSAEAAMWSDKKVTKLQSNVNEAQGIIIAGELKFDVEKAVRAAIGQKSRRLVLRLQTVRGGIMFDTEQPITLTLDTSIPTTATVKYVDADEKEIQPSKTVEVCVDSKYTYDVMPEDMRIASADSKYYIYDDEHSQRVIEKIKEVVPGDATTQNIITLKYTEITATKQLSEDLKLELCEGSDLPETVDAVFSDDSTGPAKVEWDQDLSEFEAGQSYDVTGKFAGTDVPVTATVKVVKNLEQISESLVAWYPLDANAKDASGNGNDGTAAESVKFSRENGATFNGGSARGNMIQVPKETLDDLEVKDQMTFSFWTNIDSNVDKNRNMFGIGSLLGIDGNDKGGASKHFYISGALNAFMTDNGWADGAHKGFGNVPVGKNEWHYITVVLDGKKITLYVDKEKVDTEDTDNSMTEAWNYNDGANRYLYIGNCAYGHNGDADFKGSIKDFRIYNTVLAEAQIAAAYAYEVPAEQYVEEDILSGMKGVAQDYDGNWIITNVTTAETDGKITLPRTSYGDVAVSWKSGNDTIDPATGSVKIPEAGAEEQTCKLTAMVSADDGTEDIEFDFDCAVFSVNKDIEVTEMVTLINDAQGLRSGNYTPKSWEAFETALAEAQEQARKPLVQSDFDTAKTNLSTAKAGLVKIVALKARIAALKNELAGIDQERYTQASRDALNAKLSDAEDKMGEESEADQDKIDEVLEGLPSKAVGELTLRGDKTALNNLIAEATAVKTNKDNYKEANWEAFETALTAAEAEQKKDLVQTEVTAAVKALSDAMAKLEPNEDVAVDKAALETAIKEADAEAKSLTRSHYTPETWTVYQDALAAYKAIADKPYATKNDVEKAAKALADAYAGLRPTEAQAPTEQEKTDLRSTSTTAVAEAATMKPESYTANSWARYQAAVKAMEKLAANMDSATKAQITAVTNELSAAKAALVDKSKLDKAIKDYDGLKEATYTAATWKPFKTALDAAKEVSEKEGATQQEVDDALEALNAKQSALKPAATAVKVKTVKVTADYTKLAAGKKATLKAAVTPSNAKNKKVKWTIDKNATKGKYASITQKGVLTTKAKAAGKTITVTATAQDGSKKYGSIKIKVMKGGVKKVSLKAKTKKVKVKKKLTIKATVTTTTKKAKDANTKLAWKSSNTKVATVNSKGVVTGKKAGKTTITATSTDGTKKSAKVTITVTKK